MSHLTGKRVAIIATDYFEEAELTSPRDELQQAGAAVDVIAPHTGTIQGLNHVDPGQQITVDKTLADANADDYDAVVIPGGVVNADQLRVDDDARNFVIKMMAREKPTAVICHGPWLLVSSHVVRGKRLTSYHTLQDDISNAGGEWVDQSCVVDGCLITSRTPKDLPDFNKALLKALATE